MKLGVNVSRLNEAQLAARAADLFARRREELEQQRHTNEVSDGQRELGSPAGDLRQPDKR